MGICFTAGAMARVATLCLVSFARAEQREALELFIYSFYQTERQRKSAERILINVE